MKSALIENAEKSLTICLNIQRGETLFVISDPPCEELGQALWVAGCNLCKDALLITIAQRKESDFEPPAPLAQWLCQCNAAVLITSKSLVHTQAIRAATAFGTRIMALTSVSTAMFQRSMNTDWQRLGTSTRTIAGRLCIAKKLRVTTEMGTDITFTTGSRKARADDGQINVKGALGTIPCGEAYIAIEEHSAEGTLVVDGSFSTLGRCTKHPIVLTIKNGQICKVSDHPMSHQLYAIFNTYGVESRTLAGFGIGTLDSGYLSGILFEDKKVKGTCHFMIGENASYGGAIDIPIFLDAVILSPSIYFDDRIVFNHGSFHYNTLMNLS